MNRRTLLKTLAVVGIHSRYSYSKEYRMEAKKTNRTPASAFPELELVGKKHLKSSGKSRGLRPAVWEAYSAMANAAQKEGIQIVLDSGYRDFDAQKRIWNRKYRSLSRTEKNPQKVIETIIQYSAIPGTSRHHWGTDIDIIDGIPPTPTDPEEAQYFADGGIYHPLYQWLQTHAQSFGFYEVYTQNPQRTGFAYEPWHWSFAELSRPMLEAFLALPLAKYLNDPSLKGSKHFTPDYIKNYLEKWVLGVNPDLLPVILKK